MRRRHQASYMERRYAHGQAFLGGLLGHQPQAIQQPPPQQPVPEPQEQPPPQHTFERKTVDELVTELRQRGLDTHGYKPELLARLTLHELGVSQDDEGYPALVQRGAKLWHKDMIIDRLDQEFDRLGPSKNLRNSHQHQPDRRSHTSCHSR